MANLGSPLATRVEPGIGLSTEPPPPTTPDKPLLVVSWEGTFTPTESGEYNFGLEGEGHMRAYLDGKVIAMAFHTNGVETKTGRARLEAGHPYALKVVYRGPVGKRPTLVWAKREMQPSAEAIAAAKNS